MRHVLCAHSQAALTTTEPPLIRARRSSRASQASPANDAQQQEPQQQRGLASLEFRVRMVPQAREQQQPSHHQQRHHTKCAGSHLAMMAAQALQMLLLLQSLLQALTLTMIGRNAILHFGPTVGVAFILALILPTVI